jgi:predicted small secreted protein
MKKQRIFTGLGLAALILAASLSLAGCENPAGDDPGYSIVTGRYETVPVTQHDQS